VRKRTNVRDQIYAEVQAGVDEGRSSDSFDFDNAGGDTSDTEDVDSLFDEEGGAEGDAAILAAQAAVAAAKKSEELSSMIARNYA
jgi:hypothetical protein